VAAGFVEGNVGISAVAGAATTSVSAARISNEAGVIREFVTEAA